MTRLGPVKKHFPLKAWALVDDKGTYATYVYTNRKDAAYEKNQWRHLWDAKWRIVRVIVSEAKK